MEKDKKLKRENYFFLGIFISALINIAISLWANSVSDLLNKISPAENRWIIVVGGAIVIAIFLYKLWTYVKNSFDCH